MRAILTETAWKGQTTAHRGDGQGMDSYGGSQAGRTLRRVLRYVHRHQTSHAGGGLALIQTVAITQP